MTNHEARRLEDARTQAAAWRRWGPYVSDRQWGTVREDYSADGNAWNYFPYDHARSRAYRWGEDAIGGICDDKQNLCFGLALWNGRDPHLKERLFGLGGPEGNHGEDVKELYYYLDSTPTHSYMRMLYKYPHAEFPYEALRRENKNRGRTAPEYEILDTGVFDDDRYFDVFIEYAKADVEDILARVTIHNRGRDAAAVHVLPQLWFRNTWSWVSGRPRPTLACPRSGVVTADCAALGKRWLFVDRPADLLFCDNDTNAQRLFDAYPSPGYFKDGIDDAIVNGRADAVNPDKTGTKAAVHFFAEIEGGGSVSFRLRLAPTDLPAPFADFDRTFAARLGEADEFYADLQRDQPDADARLVQRQALAGLLWTKQFFYYDVPEWLNGDPAQPPPPNARRRGRNHEWTHLNNADVISMPDKWEYPWYAAWDLAFHCVALTLVDTEFAKDQLILLTREWYMHPNGQMPAYEWAFGDVNPPVHAWAAWRVYKIDKKRTGRADTDFLERVFHKLLLNFTWWVNRKDAEGRNVFQGGFLGLDNIGVFDRSAPLPTGGFIEQADGTSWMAMYALNLMRISLELAQTKPIYQDMATKFLEHFLYIAGAMANIGGDDASLWDEADGFIYDVLHLPDDGHVTFRIRSMVGLVPLFAVEVLDPDVLDRVPEFKQRLEWFLAYRPDLANLVSRWQVAGKGERRLLSLLRGHRMKCLLKRMLDETEFLSEYGVRALSRAHKDQPYVLQADGKTFTVGYQPGESESGLFGGNSNWRGPVWFPMNYLIVESLQRFHHYYGDEFRVECPTGSGKFLTLLEVASEIARRLAFIFLRDARGRRAVFGKDERLQNDPHFRDYLTFHEYFHGDDGRGLGASHQTGWTALVAKLLQPRDAAAPAKATARDLGETRDSRAPRDGQAVAAGPARRRSRVS